MNRLFRLGAGVLILALNLALPAHGQETVPFSGYRMGTIVIKTHERALYYVVSVNEAVRYPVGVGRQGMQWSGVAHIEEKRRDPAWHVRPGAPVIPGGSPQNPMGVAAMTMRGGDYAIHGTNDPKSIGGFVSHGCIRMYNKDVLALFRRVPIGTAVIVEQ